MSVIGTISSQPKLRTGYRKPQVEGGPRPILFATFSYTFVKLRV
jgi:hypothetical protein